MARARLLNLIIKWIQAEGFKMETSMFPEAVIEKIRNFCTVTLMNDGQQTSSQKIQNGLVFI